MTIEGYAAPGFDLVASTFAATVDGLGGAGLCVYHDGEPVVDLVGGVASDERPYDDQTLQLVFSCSKGVTAIVALLLIERGLLDPDAPVARYWPEFAVAGKGSITVGEVLAHRAGLPCYDTHLTRTEVCDGHSAAAALAAQAPYWAPGSAHGYHAVTYGFLLAEIVARVDGRTLGTLLRDELTEPAGLDLWIGLPEWEEPRVATLAPGAIPPDADGIAELRRFAPGTLSGRALSLDGALPMAGRAYAYQTREVRAAELPASNAVCSARALAALYSSTVATTGGRRLLGDDTLARATATVSRGADLILGRNTHFGQGFMLPTQDLPMLSDRSFGHPGAGGSLAFADSRSRIGFAYLTTSLSTHILGDPRATALVDALRIALNPCR